MGNRSGNKDLEEDIAKTNKMRAPVMPSFAAVEIAGDGYAKERPWNSVKETVTGWQAKGRGEADTSKEQFNEVEIDEWDQCEPERQLNRLLEVWAKRVEGDGKGWVDLLAATWTKGDSRALGVQHAAAGHLSDAVLSLSSPVGEVGVDVHEVVHDDDHTSPLDLGPRRDSR